MLICLAPAMPSRAAPFPFAFAFALDFAFAEDSSSTVRPEPADEFPPALAELGFWCANLQYLPCLHPPLGKNLHGGGGGGGGGGAHKCNPFPVCS
jgi:hypothetical protein